MCANLTVPLAGKVGTGRWREIRGRKSTDALWCPEDAASGAGSHADMDTDLATMKMDILFRCFL